MDLQTALICGGVAAVSAVVIYVISVFSMREKTYEEAIAEQRKMPEENLLLGRSAKDKAKDKKQKKLGKKVKEKAADQEKSEHNDMSSKTATGHPAKVHVDFEDPEAEVVSERLPQEDKKKKKKEKVKPILLNKDEPSLIVNSPLTPSNRFEEILPKDDLLLKRNESREETLSKDSPEPASRETTKPLMTSKTTAKVDIAVVSNKREEDKIPAVKVENSVASRPERVQVANKEERELEKKKDNVAKQEKVSQKSEKNVANKTEKSAPMKSEDKSDKQTVNKVEKVVSAKAEKVVGKSEKASTEKVEKVALAKIEKPVAAKSEKSANTKSEKPVATKSEKLANTKSEKPVVVKSEKSANTKSEKPVVAKSEKSANTKSEKPVAAKSEKSANAKSEKPPTVKSEKALSMKSEKPATTKLEKSSGKNDNQSQQKSEKQSSKSEKLVASQDSPVSATTEVKEASPAPTLMKQEAAPASNTAVLKERSRKKKSELHTLLQMSGDRDGVNMSLLLPIVQKAELSRSEIQILIDHLLNKQQNAGASDAEWIEGRQDPVVKLKKQLAEKEKALSEEQEAMQGVQAKLKELRQEYNSERSRLTHSCRQLEESLLAKTNEAKALTARLQHNQEAINNEKQALVVQVQQLQQKLKEEHVRLCQLQDQETTVQQEFMTERQQMELHMTHLSEQEKTLKAQVTQLMAQVKEQEQVNGQLNLELQSLRDTQISENNLLHERAAHTEKQLLMYKENMEQNMERAQELAQQVEEFNIIRGDLEHRLNTGQQRETAVQYEISNLHKEVEDLKAQLVGYESLKSDSNRLRSDNDKLSNQLHQIQDLQLENQRLREENEVLSTQVGKLPELQREALQLREENENLAAQVTAMTERPAAEGRENGDIQFHEEKQELPKGDFTLFEKTIQQKEAQVMQLSAELEEKSSVLKQLQSEINTYKTDISKLNSELDEQRRKNNDLRKKNWKAMEALSTMEKSLQSKVQYSSPELVSEVSQKIVTEQQTVTKQFLQRIFPDVRIEDCKNYESWLKQFETSAAHFLSEVSSKTQEMKSCKTSEESSDVEELEKQNAQLQGMVANYKTIIDDTAGMLKQLQNQVEEGEIRWRKQMQVKEAELEAVKQELSSSPSLDNSANQSNSLNTQSKVEELQAKLTIEEQEKQDLDAKLTSLTRNVEQMKEERDGLSAELKKEQEKSQDLSKELVRLRSLVQIGKDSLNQEREMVVNLQQQVDKLNGVHQNHSVSSNGPSTESSTVAQSLSASLQPLSETATSEKGAKIKKKKTTKQASVKQRRLTGWFRKKVTPSKPQKTEEKQFS